MKFIFAFLLALPAYADQISNSAGESAPKTVDETAANPACLSTQTVENYSKSAVVNRLTRQPKPKAVKKGLSLRTVRLALEKQQLVKSVAELEEAAERGGEMDDLTAESDKPAQPARELKDQPVNARDAGPWLERNGFVNLSDCPEWKKTLKDPKKVPKGAIVVYRHPRKDNHPGHIEIATPSGFWSDRPRQSHTYSHGLEVVGVFVRPNL